MSPRTPFFHWVFPDPVLLIKEKARDWTFRVVEGLVLSQRKPCRTEDLMDETGPVPPADVPGKKTGRYVTQADALAFVGQYQEALRMLDRLPAADRESSAALPVRLRIHLGLKEWKKGISLASRVRAADPVELRELAGRLILAWATELRDMGDLAEAHRRVASLSLLWPEGKTMISHWHASRWRVLPAAV